MRQSTLWSRCEETGNIAFEFDITTDNKRLAEQTRKILGKHYASKYRVR